MLSRVKSPISKIYLFRGVIDFRLGLDRLISEVESYNPIMNQGYFVFFCKRRIRVKILYWDRDGFCLWLKRLEVGRFNISLPEDNEQKELEVTFKELKKVLEGISLERISFQKRIRDK